MTKEKLCCKGYAYMILLYDFERYAGEGRKPGYVNGRDPRFGLAAYWHSLPGETFGARLLWSVSANTYDEARRMVCPGGKYFDRTDNFPSPMVPVEGWYYSNEPICPRIEKGGVAVIGGF